MIPSNRTLTSILSIHDLHEDVDSQIVSHILRIDLSIHDLQEEVDGSSEDTLMGIPIFQFTTSKRRSTLDTLTPSRFLFHFQFTTSKRRSTLTDFSPVRLLSLSIHDLQEEVDLPDYSQQTPRQSFNSRPPRGGRQHFFTKNLLF